MGRNSFSNQSDNIEQLGKARERIEKTTYYVNEEKRELMVKGNLNINYANDEILGANVPPTIGNGPAFSC